MFEGYTPIKSLVEGLYHYQIQDDDVKNNQITYFNVGFKLYKTFFPWNLVSENLKTRLMKPFIINNSMVNYSFFIVCNTKSQCHIQLAKSISALVHLSEHIVELSDQKTTYLSKALVIEELTFVNAIAQKNLFFVLKANRKSGIYTCIEVHPSKNEAYRKVYLHKNQLTISKWRGKFTSFV